MYVYMPRFKLISISNKALFWEYLPTEKDSTGPKVSPDWGEGLKEQMKRSISLHKIESHVHLQSWIFSFFFFFIKVESLYVALVIHLSHKSNIVRMNVIVKKNRNVQASAYFVNGVKERLILKMQTISTAKSKTVSQRFWRLKRREHMKNGSNFSAPTYSHFAPLQIYMEFQLVFKR